MGKRSHSSVNGIGVVSDPASRSAPEDIRIRAVLGNATEAEGRAIPRSMLEGSDTEKLHALMFLSQRDNDGMMPLSNIIMADLDLVRRNGRMDSEMKLNGEELGLVIGALDSADPVARSVGAAVVSRLGPRSLQKKDIPKLIGALMDPNLDVREGIQNALASYSSADPKSLIRMIDSFKRSDRRLIDQDASKRLDTLRKEADIRKGRKR